MNGAEMLVGRARERQARRMITRERAVVGGLAGSFVLAAAAITLLLPSDRDTDPFVVAGLVLGYAAVSRVEFEIGSGLAVPTQLVFLPMLFFAPLPLVPWLVVLGFLLADLVDMRHGGLHGGRLANAFTDSWHTIGPVLVIGLLVPGEPLMELFGFYMLALGAQLACDLLPAALRERLAHGIPVRETLRSVAWSYRMEAVLTPVGVMAAVAATESPLALLSIGPLVWLLWVFSSERKERYAAALELGAAYRGTVLLLADVVNADDTYTGDHCRSVVDLVSQVAQEMGFGEDRRQEFEFAALLHDVGKISIPKEILHKPASLTDEEFAIMKRHTVAGQLLLDRVGGVLGRVGQIVRSSHERWDGRGYPDGLAGEEIPLAARIVFCCDAYNAMTTDRPYRAAMSEETAIQELRDGAGTQFDSAVVATVIKVLRSSPRGGALELRGSSLLSGLPLVPQVESRV